jgi:hypothetical protein
MRLLIIGRLSGELVAASKIAMQRGAAVTQADAVAQGLNVLRAKGADLIMIDVAQPIAGSSRRSTPNASARRSSPAAPAPTPAPRSRRSRPAPGSTSRSRPTPS